MQTGNPLLYFLQTDSANAVFSLLFAFTRDDACTDDSLSSFEEALHDIVLGVQVPREALEKLEAIYDSTMTSDRSFDELAEEVVKTFEDRRSILLIVTRIAIRLANDSGYITTQDRHRLEQLMTACNFTAEEAAYFDDDERLVLRRLHGQRAPISRELEKFYAILECSPDATDMEVRQCYRRLAKQYHPDTSKRHHAHLSEKAVRAHFNALQNAYQRIKKSRVS
jgi:DnaJ like chaperone protein